MNINMLMTNTSSSTTGGESYAPPSTLMTQMMQQQSGMPVAVPVSGHGADQMSHSYGYVVACRVKSCYVVSCNYGGMIVVAGDHARASIHTMVYNVYYDDALSCMYVLKVKLRTLPSTYQLLSLC